MRNDQSTTTFSEAVGRVFAAEFGRLFRYLDRASGDPDLAGDLAQEAFVRLYQRGSMPDSPGAWLVTVANNLRRNAGAKVARRRRLMTLARSDDALADPAPRPDDLVLAQEGRARVRAVIDRMPERESQLLLLRAEGYGYREIAAMLGLHEASVGTLVARARRAFLKAYEGGDDAS